MRKKDSYELETKMTSDSYELKGHTLVMGSTLVLPQGVLTLPT